MVRDVQVSWTGGSTQLVDWAWGLPYKNFQIPPQCLSHGYVLHWGIESSDRVEPLGTVIGNLNKLNYFQYVRKAVCHRSCLACPWDTLYLPQLDHLTKQISCEMLWTRGVERLGETGNAWGIFVGKLREKKVSENVERDVRIIKYMCIIESVCEDINWNSSGSWMVQWRVFVMTVMNLRILKQQGIYWKV